VQAQHLAASFLEIMRDRRITTMSFFRELFSGKKATRAQLKRYVEMEYAPAEREEALTRLIREANL